MAERALNGRCKVKGFRSLTETVLVDNAIVKYYQIEAHDGTIWEEVSVIDTVTYSVYWFHYIRSAKPKSSGRVNWIPLPSLS